MKEAVQVLRQVQRSIRNQVALMEEMKTNLTNDDGDFSKGYIKGIDFGKGYAESNVKYIDELIEIQEKYEIK